MCPSARVRVCVCVCTFPLDRSRVGIFRIAHFYAIFFRFICFGQFNTDNVVQSPLFATVDARASASAVRQTENGFNIYAISNVSEW